MKKKLLFFTPLFMLLAVCILLIAGLNQDPKKISSALIDKPVPEFYQANLLAPSQKISPKNFPKQAFLLNVWGSWCGYCKEEHPLLMDIAKTTPIIGIDYRDNPQNGREMLKRMGNPFLFTIDDSHGELALKLGVDGAPETYLVDMHGVIRYRHSGLLERETWENIFVPKIQELMKK
ncbi:thiol:disulfide interchange protein [Rodentibacter caecimuris]|uniref:Thiol:disulfide interchange protein n=1 Tax=Rodentibacter caecimuris TaxID=1796644 RepID=A0A9X8VZA4_9PAST|nr:MULTISPECIES: DsbE family thiol:disulfide interchange protein [Pasteurellaceae]AOF52675.1 Putative thiol:disulfide oxidoreductase, nitrite reductase complex assembly [Pasteurellaceae bacterium NI1060]MCQ9123400.1 DsbE family thiol:disulfide interchange protein [Rodentibacter heylii]MCR1837292.1 DsbE family thiol:disulfide interchange protein [Pasteurella caecimuris]MCU0106205.1 DsbE family thiol:disulfide interchange protein [Pasteurella caecimuris]MCX2960801.1 DsbE family thiol:disulfide i